MYEGVVIGKKNAKAGMRVIPAEDALVGIIAVFDFVDVLPGVLREGATCAPPWAAFTPAIARLDLDVRLRWTPFLADQDAADFGLAVGAGVLANLAHHARRHC